MSNKNPWRSGEYEQTVEIPAIVYLRLVRSHVDLESENQAELLRERDDFCKMSTEERREWLKKAILKCIFYEECIKTDQNDINEKIIIAVDRAVDSRIFELSNMEEESE